MMGAIKKFYEEKKGENYVEFVKPSRLPDFGLIHIETICIESWCDEPVFYFTEKDGTQKYKSIVNYQLKEIFQKLFQESFDSSPILIDSFDIDDDGRFIVKESKNGKKYNYFVLE